MRDRRGLRILPTAECLRRLRQGGVGRVAVTVKALPAIFPVNYAVVDGDIVFRSNRGSKLTAAASQAVIAFEADQTEAMGHTGWSVLVVGQAHVVSDPDEIETLDRLPLRPWASAVDDQYVRVVAGVISGRELTHEVVDAGVPAKIGA